MPQNRPKPAGTNLQAAESTIAALGSAGRLEQIDDARITAFLNLARAVDADPGNASLWREYRQAEAALREDHDGGADAFAELLAELRGTPLGDSAQS